MFDVTSLRKYGEARDDDNLCSRAADEIERLRAALKRIAEDRVGDDQTTCVEIAWQALNHQQKEES